MAKRAKAEKNKNWKMETEATNRKALWQAYRDLQKRADAAWEKLRADVKKNVKNDVLIKDQNHLLLLLGECNYMARECMRMADERMKKHW